MKKPEYSLLEKLKLAGAVLFTGLASIVSGAEVSDANNTGSEVLQNLKPKTTVVSEEKTEKKPVEFYAETTFATNYVFGSGAIIGKKDPKNHSGVNQTLLSASKGGLCGYLWTDFDFQDAETGNGWHELDFGVDYTFKVAENLSATVGYAAWNYPDGFSGKHGDHILQGKLAYNGFFDIEGGLIHLLDHEDVDNGEFYFAKISKTFPMGKIGNNAISIKPSLSTGATDNFYGCYGLSTFTPGIDLSIDKKDRPFCNVFVRFQDGKSGADDLVYGGVTFPIPLGKKK